MNGDTQITITQNERAKREQQLRDFERELRIVTLVFVMLLVLLVVVLHFAPAIDAL